MKQRERLHFSLKQLYREWKSGHLWVLTLALITAITSHTSIGHFSDRIGRAIAENANQLIAGDLILSSYRPINPEVYKIAQALEVASAEKKQFSTMVQANEAFLLVSVTAASSNYPLKGNIMVADNIFGESYAKDKAPAPGNVWLDQRVATQLALKPGDAINIGETTLTFSHVLIQTLDSSGGFYNLTPRILINQDDLAATAILQPGSRVRHQAMFAGDETAIQNLQETLNTQLQPGQTLRGLSEEQPGIASTLDKATQYTGLASLVALLLAAVAVASSGRHYIQNHFDTSALLRCLGASQKDMLIVFIIQLSLIALICGVIGNLLGFGLQQLLLWLISDLLPQNIPFIRWHTMVSGMFLSFFMLLGFTLPSLIRLKNVSPNKVLRQNLEPLPIAGWLTYGGAIIAILLLMWFYTDNLVLTLGVMVGAASVFAIAIGLIFSLFALFNRLLPYLPTAIRPGVRNFLRRDWATSAQTIAFGLTIMALMLIYFIRTNLIETWMATLPSDAPNHFVINLQDADTEKYQAFLAQNDVNIEPLYPVIRGRLTAVNGVPVTEHVDEQNKDHESIRRELNFTWSDELPTGNELIAGNWWPNDQTVPVVSVEQDVARDLNLTIGDELTFISGANSWQATVTSLRTVDWGNFKPNFYMIFNPPTLSDLPRTWIHSFYIPTDKKPQLAELVQSFPSISLIELDTLINQAKTIINQVTLVIQSLLVFVLLAAFAVTLSELHASLGQRIREGAIIRTLGANTAHIRRAQWIEFAAIGLFSAIVAMIGTELINRIIYTRLFEISYQSSVLSWLVCFILAMMIIGFLGVYNARKVIQESPISVLRG